MTNHAALVDELRLRYSEDAHWIETLEAKKRPAVEIELKRQRLGLLKEIGAEFARLTSQSKER